MEAAPLEDRDRRALLTLARVALGAALENRDPPSPGAAGVEVTPVLRRPAGAFVTLRNAGRLRGCIGEIEARRPLWQAVMGMAVAAGSRDIRFRPVTRDELAAIDVHISVLTPLLEIEDWREIELGRHGIVLERGGRMATFLPQVAPEQGWSLEETLTQLSRKAGLGPDAWRKGARFLVFEADAFGEDEV